MLCVRVVCATSLHAKSRRKKFPKKIVDKIYKKSKGKCYHCKTSLRQEFDIDHYPVRYADIEDQCCLGVTNELDETNLVVSCRNCNRSHKHEKVVWCRKYSQCPCKKHWLIVPLRFFIVLCVCYSVYYLK